MIRRFEFEPVNSSMIAGIFHDGSDLKVKFHNESVYLYREVPVQVYELLLESESVGKAFRQHVLGQYTEHKIS